MTDRKHPFGGLTEILTDIATARPHNGIEQELGSLVHDATREVIRERSPLDSTQGPNNWDSITSSDFGPQHDFTLEDYVSIFIFTPVSEAALQWCYAHLPEDCPRWGSRGFAIEHRYIEDIVRGARRDGLMSVTDYEQAMEEQNQLQYLAATVCEDCE